MQTKEKYKLSRYNIYHKDGDVQYLWNTYSDALLKLDAAAQEYVRTFSGVDDKSMEFDLLKSNGFIVYEQLDEYGRVCLEEKQAVFTKEPTSILFAIAPGMGCNYSCSYCFEGSSDLTGVMTAEVANDVVEYICQQLHRNSNVKELHIRWFGGEPLLFFDIVETISRKVIAYTQQNSIKYSASIFTNGRYLDSKAVALLRELCIGRTQITVDGMSETYCNSKGASCEDFHVVIDNIRCAAEKIRICIRINIPGNDATEAIKITDYLLSQCNLKGKVKIYFAYVCDYSLHLTAAHEEFRNYVHNFFTWVDHVVEHYGITEAKSILPKRLISSCTLIKTSNACIGPRGELCKCEHCFGNDAMTIGNIWMGRFFNDAELMYCSTVGDHTNKACSLCDYLPVCMGGCANDRLKGVVKFDCESNKLFMFKLKLLEGGVNI